MMFRTYGLSMMTLITAFVGLQIWVGMNLGLEYSQWFIPLAIPVWIIYVYFVWKHYKRHEHDPSD